MKMDAVDLIARENEFKKLNKQLEKKTESLMKEIEDVMQKQDIFSEFSHSLTLSPVHRQTKAHCNNAPKELTPTKVNTKKKRPQSKSKPENSIMEIRDNLILSNTTQEIIDDANKGQAKSCDCCILSKNTGLKNDMEFLYAFVSVSVKDNVLPQSFLKDNVSIENVCKFLSAKVKLIQEQIDRLQGTIDKKVKQCEGHMTQIAELESERMALINRANNMRTVAADVKAKYGVMQNRFNEKDRLYKEQRSITDKLTSEMKSLNIRNVSLEARCASQDEVISNLKQQLEISRLSEKELRDSTRSLVTSHQGSVTNLETKIKTLTAHINKQTSLIDNLRKQNALLLTEGAVRALENNYCEFLNQDF